MTTPGQEALLGLQELDTAMDQARHRRAALAERAELHAVDDALGELHRRHVTLSAQRDEIAVAEQALEEELVATETRISQVNKRLYGGTVSASRELQAMAADIESLQSRAASLEEAALGKLEEREPLDASLTALEEQAAAMAKRRRELTELLTAAEAEIDGDISALEARRREQAASVAPGLLEAYEDLRRRLGGVGAARLVGDRCGGCHLSIPATELDRIRHHPEELAFCDQCGRILVG